MGRAAGDESSHEHPLRADADGRVAPGAWNQIRVAAAGPTLRVWFNRMHPSADEAAGLRLEVTDPSAPVLAGPIGLRTFGTAASFDNVIVLPLDALPTAGGE